MHTDNDKTKTKPGEPTVARFPSASVSICAPSGAKAPSSRLRPPAVALTEKFQLLTDCRDEAEQRSLYEELTSRGHVCRVWVL